MATGKTVVVSREMDPELWDVFMSMKPAGWKITQVNPNEDEPKTIKELEDAEYLLSVMSGKVFDKYIQNAKKLKLIQTMGQDTGHLPVKLALDKGIPVANAGGANAIDVAEHTVLFMLASLRRLLPFNKAIREGKWRGTLDRKGSHELYDRTVGIVGFGNIGRRVAKLCYNFGANIIYHERFFVPYALRADMKAKPVGLEELLKQSDVVSLHVPSFAANKAMIGWEQLNMMKKTAYLINTSRGANIDEAALLRALKETRIAGAALDVFDPEPPDPKNPLLHLPNIIVTPHSAALTWEMWGKSFETVWRNVVMVSEGKEPLNRIREF